MPPKRDVEAPVCLSGFFSQHDDDENEEEDEENAFSQTYEVTELDILGKVLRIRQFAWHKANANKIWPGTFNLADYLDLHQAHYKTGPILELGAATGALTLFLSTAPHSFDISTSDIDDDGEVQENIAHNFHLNGNTCPPLHIPHTWGEGWPMYSHPTISNTDNAIIQPKSTTLPIFKFVIASDILLYVSAYPALVKTLCELFGCPYTPSATTVLPPVPPASSSSSSSSDSDSTHDGAVGIVPLVKNNIAAGTTQFISDSSLSPQLSPSTTTVDTTETAVPIITKAVSTITIEIAPSSSSSSTTTVAQPNTTPTTPSQTPSQTSSHGQGQVEEFLMSWNRRIAESKVFFDLMEQAGFVHVHKGKCIYSFTRCSNTT